MKKLKTGHPIFLKITYTVELFEKIIQMKNQG